MIDINSKIKFRHQAFVHIQYPMQFQYSSSFNLNIDTVDADTTVSGKEFHMLLCKKVLCQLKSRVLLIQLHMMAPCVLDWAQGKEPSAVKIVITLEQFISLNKISSLSSTI